LLFTKSIDVVLNKLLNGDNESIVILDKFIKSIVNIIEKTEELKEELIDFNETYQFHITDLNFSFWINAIKKQITYEMGINEDATLRVFFTKDILSKVLTKEMGGIEAYMKGLIKIKGNLSHAIKIKNYLSHLIKYLLNHSESINVK
jgi:putative sterol carrier protein